MVNAGAIANSLLNSLPSNEIEAMTPDLQLVSWPLRQTIYEAGTALKYVFFPEDSLASVISAMTDGAMVEVGMIGSEGLVGMPVLLGTGISGHQVIVQGKGNAYRMEASRCKALFDRSQTFRDITLRFFEDFLNLAGQTAACNRLHSIEQRCARWLLMATDRMRSDDIPMTHEFLSAMLGTRRAGVTETAGELQRLGFIRYHHGHLTILDRAGLASAACECYNADHSRLEQFRKLRA